MRLVLDATSEALLVLDRDGGIVLWNRNLEEFVGLGRDELELGDVQAVVRALGDAAGRGLEELLADPRESRLVEMRGGRQAACHVVELLRPRHLGYRLVSFVDVTAEREHLRTLEHRALHDRLTGLPNRDLLLDRLLLGLARRARDGRPLAVLFVDLDGFKAVNDRYGHAVGDLVLIEVARRLRREVRGADTVSRFGGDEFVVLCEEVAGEGTVAAICSRVAHGLSQPFLLEGGTLRIGASIGAIIEWDRTADAEGVVKRADALMYRAKQYHAGPGETTWQIASEGRQRDELETDEEARLVRRALELDELYLEYLPLVGLADGKISGVEALVRWRHPELGVRGPAEFLELAEETKLILPIGEWVIKEACHAARRLLLAVGQPVPMFVNVSAVELADSGLPNLVLQAASDQSIDTSTLGFDIPENALGVDPGALAERLDELRSLASMLVVDDFGSGRASIEELRYLGFGGVKIDRPLISRSAEDARALSLARAIVERAHEFRLKVTAEGVETPEQLATVRALGCDTAQGHALHGPPRELDELLSLLT
jgi:diguanylate cyclase (GGDEF)-like protein